MQIAAQAEYQEAIGSTALEQAVPRLTSALQEPVAYPEDVFQARICLASVHWTLSNPALTLQNIPEDVYEAYRNVTKGNREGIGWSSICAIKGAYIRGQRTSPASQVLLEMLSTHRRLTGESQQDR